MYRRVARQWQRLLSSLKTVGATNAGSRNVSVRVLLSFVGIHWTCRSKLADFVARARLTKPPATSFEYGDLLTAFEKLQASVFWKLGRKPARTYPTEFTACKLCLMSFAEH